MKTKLLFALILFLTMIIPNCDDDNQDPPLLPEICGDSISPEFILPDSGSVTGTIVAGMNIPAFEVEFEIIDDGEIVEIHNAEHVVDNTYKTIVDPSIPPDIIIEAIDQCGNVGTATITYEIEILYYQLIYGWPWYVYEINYRFII